MLSRYSHSALGTFRSCPRKYKFARIDKVEVPPRLEAHTLLGNIVHRHLKDLYRWAADGKLYPLEDLLKAYSSDWEKESRNVEVSSEHMTVDDYIAKGSEMLTNYYRKFQPFEEAKLLGAEMRLNFELPGTRYPVLAIVDRLHRRPDGVVEICDYKTGRNLPNGPGDPSFKRQMGLYQLGVQAKFPHFEKIELVQYFLQHEESIPSVLRPDELEELTEQFRVEILETINAELNDDFPTQESGLCNFCEYFHLCPAKRHRQTIEAEEQSGNENTPAQLAAAKADRFVDITAKMKELKNEQTALREELVAAARELDVTRISGTDSDVSVRIRPEFKLPTKTSDPDKFAELSFLASQWGLDECFTLDGRILLKEISAKGKLSAERQDKLGEFISEIESSRVSVVKKKETGK
ncbi:MAG: PD-(D/E)XK nuclease family protein [bacterium]|nr:PD-(D/E)XK nuclease family protein [bacterium]